MRETYVHKTVDLTEEPYRFSQSRIPVFESGFGVEIPVRIRVVVFDYGRRFWNRCLGAFLPR